MKSLFFLLCFLAIASGALAQNTYPWISSGNVGIGTASPGTKLNVYSSDNSNPVKAVFGETTSATTLYSGYNSQENSAIEIKSNSGASVGGPWLVLSNSVVPNTASINAGVVSFTLPATAASEKRAAIIVSETSANSTSSITANLSGFILTMLGHWLNACVLMLQVILVLALPLLPKSSLSMVK